MRCFWLKQLHNIDERASEIEREVDAANRVDEEAEAKFQRRKKQIELEISALQGMLAQAESRRHAAADRRGAALGALQQRMGSLLQDTEKQVQALERCVWGREGSALRSAIPELPHSGALLLKELETRRAAVQDALVHISAQRSHAQHDVYAEAGFGTQTMSQSRRGGSGGRSKRRSFSAQPPANATHGATPALRYQSANEQRSKPQGRRFRTTAASEHAAAGPPSAAGPAGPISGGPRAGDLLQRCADAERQATHRRLRATFAALHADGGPDTLEAATDLAAQLRAGLREAFLMQDDGLTLAVVEGLAGLLKRHSGLAAMLRPTETELVAALM
eukprot:EG_transcript_12377